MTQQKPKDPNRLVAVTLDEDSIGRSSSDTCDTIAAHSRASPFLHTSTGTCCPSSWICASYTTDNHHSCALQLALRWGW